MENQKFLFYRYNSFFKKIDNWFLVRVGSKEYKVKNENYKFETVTDLIARLQIPQRIQIIETLTDEEKGTLSLLIKMKSVLISEIDYYETNTFQYLAKSYEDFNIMQNKISALFIELYVLNNVDKKLIETIFEEKKRFYLDYNVNPDCTNKIDVFFINSIFDAKNMLDKLDLYDKEIRIIATTCLKKNFVVAINSKQKMILILKKIISEFAYKDVHIDEKFIRFLMNYIFLMIIDQQSSKAIFKNLFITENFTVINLNMVGIDISSEQMELSIDEIIPFIPKRDKNFCVNEFIKVSKALFDLDFDYEFSKKDKVNIVNTRIKYQDIQIDAIGESDFLLDATESSIKKSLTGLFLKRGISIVPIIGEEEIKQYINLKRNKRVKIFQDFGVFRESGVFLFEELI